MPTWVHEICSSRADVELDQTGIVEGDRKLAIAMGFDRALAHAASNGADVHTPKCRQSWRSGYRRRVSLGIAH